MVAHGGNLSQEDTHMQSHGPDSRLLISQVSDSLYENIWKRSETLYFFDSGFASIFAATFVVYYGISCLLHFGVPKIFPVRSVRGGKKQNDSDTWRDAILHKKGYGVLKDENLLHRIYELWMIAIHIGGHCGYEIFPYVPHVSQLLWAATGMSGQLRKLLNDVYHHDIHHQYPGFHFSLYFTHWDKLLGTIHPKWSKTSHGARGVAGGGGQHGRHRKQFQRSPTGGHGVEGRCEVPSQLWGWGCKD
eukprot:753289-Hanusia_phi.AAC.5